MLSTSRKNLLKLASELEGLQSKVSKALKPSARKKGRKPSPKNTWANGRG